ncbi:MAG: rhamnulokinase [Defluviitaleaceae bacterium]|nr:rhamnulokinase [Defluviitaleaceae bacterium]
MNFLAIDIGASSGRHVLGTFKNGVFTCEEVHRFPNEIKNIPGKGRQTGTLCWDTDALFVEIIAGMKKCADLGKIPQSVGIDTWGVDFVNIEPTIEACQTNCIHPAVSYRDSRTNGMDAEVSRFISESELYARTGIQKMPFNTIYQLMALKKINFFERGRGELLLIPDYFHFKLSGTAKTEYTNATTTGLINARTRVWDDEIIKKCGFPREIFGEIVPPGTVLGRLLPEIKTAVGYDCNVVLPATHDTASAVVAVPKENALYISSGTWSLMGIERDTPDTGEKSRAANFTNEGGYNSYRYLKNIMGLWIIQNVKKELGDKFSYAQLNEMAENANVETAIDATDKRLFAPKNMTETICEMCREAGEPVPQNPGEIAAVVYNSLAKSYSQTAAQIEGLTGKTYESICIIGGGAKAEYLNKQTKKYCNKTIYAGPTEATATGNLIVQMITAGVLPDLKTARKALGGGSKILMLVFLAFTVLPFFSACGGEAATPTRGVWHESTFISESLELRLILPNNQWRAYSDDEIIAQLENSSGDVIHDFFAHNVQTASTIALTHKPVAQNFSLREHLENCAAAETEKFAAHALQTQHSIIGITPLAGIEWLTKRTEIYSPESGIIALSIHLSSVENGYLSCLNFLVDDDAEFLEITSWFSWFRG